MSGIEGDVGIGRGRLLQRLLHRPAGGVVDMDDAAVAVPALAGQVPAVAVVVGVEGHAELGQPLDRRRRVLDDELDRGAVVEAGAGDHRVLDMASNVSPGSSTAAIPPCAQPVAPSPLASTATLKRCGEVERRRQPGRAGADDRRRR